MELDEELAALRRLHVRACRLTKEEARDLIVRQARAEGRTCLSTAAAEALEGHEGFEGSRLEGRSCA